MRRNTENDKVVQNLTNLIKKIEKESQVSQEEQAGLNKELKTINQEIESYNRQLMELEKKEKNADSGNQKHDRRELIKANNAMKSAIHQKLVVREKEKFDI